MGAEIICAPPGKAPAFFAKTNGGNEAARDKRLGVRYSGVPYTCMYVCACMCVGLHRTPIDQYIYICMVALRKTAAHNHTLSTKSPDSVCRVQ